MRTVAFLYIHLQMNTLNELRKDLDFDIHDIHTCNYYHYYSFLVNKSYGSDSLNCDSDIVPNSLGLILNAIIIWK